MLTIPGRHGDIEDTLLVLAMARAAGGKKFDKMMVSRVYFGNWLRDYCTYLTTTITLQPILTHPFSPGYRCRHRQVRLRRGHPHPPLGPRFHDLRLRHWRVRSHR
jgi:hypothetical protein